MAEFKVEILKLENVRNHPNADRLAIANVNDYIIITLRDLYKDGDLVAYIPEGSIIPDSILDEMGLTGRLAGKQHNRVKAARLRGGVSQGLIYSISGKALVDHDVKFGEDITELLGITKWVPPIPICMKGKIFSLYEHNFCDMPKFDVENLKKYPKIFQSNEMVEITEKLHGTCCVIGIIPGLNDDMAFGKNKNGAVSSKGLSDRGFSFQNVQDNETNVYVIIEKQYDVVNKMTDYFKTAISYNLPVFLIGELYGSGIQDLQYGCNVNEKHLAIFDIKVGELFLTPPERKTVLELLELPSVPVLYKGLYNSKKVKNLTEGKEQVSSSESNIREGVVIRPMQERRDDESGLGRVILKHISDAYLLRNNATEYN